MPQERWWDIYAWHIFPKIHIGLHSWPCTLCNKRGSTGIVWVTQSMWKAGYFTNIYSHHCYFGDISCVCTMKITVTHKISQQGERYGYSDLSCHLVSQPQPLPSIPLILNSLWGKIPYLLLYHMHPTFLSRLTWPLYQTAHSSTPLNPLAFVFTILFS